jgi:hypothetical protein
MIAPRPPFNKIDGPTPCDCDARFKARSVPPDSHRDVNELSFTLAKT